jgi:glucosamine--fructose-6-phosphate aminotransferase (isomerizing)
MSSSKQEIKKTVKKFPLEKETISKNGYDHFMLKEINEEPELVKKLLNLYTENNKVKDIFDIKKYKNIDIVACGSASFAGQLGKYYIEKFANIRVNVYFASEYRYQKNFFTKDTLVILISQSGETADTLAAIELAKSHGAFIFGICNVVGASIPRAAHSGSAAVQILRGGQHLRVHGGNVHQRQHIRVP